jgi:N-methylhydantoinase A
MGGTTAKCALIRDGQFDVQPIYYVGGYDRGFPLKTAVLDIVEVGAGGGSIAAVDAQGRLSVGPRSAGSEPGPVAYGRGGIDPTVTDANLVLGRIGAGSFVGGRLQLDREAAGHAIAERIAAPLGYSGGTAVETAAQGILELAVSTMAGAIKEITIERGLDARDFTLMVFGGGGPLFGSVLARRLRIPTVIVTPHPGNFSTLGMLIAGARLDLARTLLGRLQDDGLASFDAAFDELEASARATMASELDVSEVRFEHWIDARYRGQTHTVRVRVNRPTDVDAFRQAFEQTYQERYGHINSQTPIELLGARIGAEAEVPRPDLQSIRNDATSADAGPSTRREVYFPLPHRWLSTTVFQREHLRAGQVIDGPAIIEEFSSTTVLQPGDRAVIGTLGEIKIDCTEPSGDRDAS